MKCKLLQNGIAIQYNQIIKPCCAFSPTWDHSINNTDLSTWHNSDSVRKLVDSMENDIWPNECSQCENHEAHGISSMRQQGNSAYHNYEDKDITLEIRPGNVCNLACQTCWPEASSRVTSFYQQAGLTIRDNVVSIPLKDFSCFLPIRDRIKNIVILGGETFYDKNCLNFLEWLIDNEFASNITMFTNGSHVNFDLLERYKHHITLVFSMDAVGKPSEYIRFGSNWEHVKQNYMKAKTLPNVETRVNITLSTYNYWYLPSLLDFLLEDWPTIVTFGRADTSANSNYMNESIIPIKFRSDLITNLTNTLKKIMKSNIDINQKTHAIHNLKSVVDNLKHNEWNVTGYEKFKSFIEKMDAVKSISINDYCESVASIL